MLIGRFGLFSYLFLLSIGAASCRGAVTEDRPAGQPCSCAQQDEGSCDPERAGDPTADTPSDCPCDCGDSSLPGDENPIGDPGASTGDPAGPIEEQDPLPVRVDAVSSQSVTISWDAVANATAIQVSIGPEPRDPVTGTLPSQLDEATLPATATSYTVESLAASVDVFVLVRALRVADAPLWGVVHARTQGGPRTSLATPLREVHGYGTSTLMLVLANPGTRYEGGALTGNLGSAWQGGTWTVRRLDGSPVGVTGVHRHSIPVGQPDYPVAYNRYGSDNIVDVDHRIFLVLQEPIGEHDILQVAHSGASGTALDVRVPFSDRYLETPFIQVNQVGYNPRATERWAYLSGWMGGGGGASFAGIPATAEVLAEPLDPRLARPIVSGSLPVSVRVDNNSFAGSDVRQIDLSSVPAFDGVRLRVRVPGVGVSWPTAVSEEAASKIFYVVWRGLFHNRWCGNLAPQYTEWSRPADHCAAYFVSTGLVGTGGKFPSSTPTDSAAKRPLIGGHHDAGDFDIRPYHVVVAQYLLRAYELHPERYSDGQLTIPESGNGIPDVLDEGLWSVAAWEQLQRPDGGVGTGVESHRHPAGIYFANEDQLPYWTYDPAPWHTAYVAGLMAQAAYLVRPFDAGRSGELEASAVAAYGWAQAHAAPQEYLLYAAGELFRLTRDPEYAGDFEALWAAIDDWGAGAFDNIAPATKIYPGAFVGYTPAMADFVMAYINTPGARADIVSTSLARLTGRADGAAGMVIDSWAAHRHGRPSGSNPDWGADVGAGRDGDMIYQRTELEGLTDEQWDRYFNALSLSLDYILGCNPAGYSFVTGLGSRSPREPLHIDSLSFIKAQGMPPIPGIPVYGPVNSMPGSSYYSPIAAAYSPSFNSQPQSLRLTDTRAAVNMNEFSVWEIQASLAELTAALLGSFASPPDSWLPGGAEHRSTLSPQSADLDLSR